MLAQEHWLQTNITVDFVASIYQQRFWSPVHHTGATGPLQLGAVVRVEQQLRFGTPHSFPNQDQESGECFAETCTARAETKSFCPLSTRVGQYLPPGTRSPNPAYPVLFDGDPPTKKTWFFQFLTEVNHQKLQFHNQYPSDPCHVIIVSPWYPMTPCLHYTPINPIIIGQTSEILLFWPTPRLTLTRL